VAEQILRILLAEPDLELTVAVGGRNPHLASLEQLLERAGRPIRLLRDVSDMPALMVWADLAVAGAGTTSWEMCMMGLPAALCLLAPNQEKIASELARLGAAVDLGYTDWVPAARTEATLRDLLRSQSKRLAMSTRGREIVDGRGTERVLAFLWGEPTLRRTIESDCRSFWWGAIRRRHSVWRACIRIRTALGMDYMMLCENGRRRFGYQRLGHRVAYSLHDPSRSHPIRGRFERSHRWHLVDETHNRCTRSD
jgi:hypothetical protein